MRKTLGYRKAEINKKGIISDYVSIIIFFLVFLLGEVVARGNEKERKQNKAKSSGEFYKIFFMMPCEIKNILSLDFKLYACAILPHKSNHNSKKEKIYVLVSDTF